MSGIDKLLLATNAAGDLSAADAAQMLASAAVEAGKLALSMQEAGVRTWNKEHDSPVTEADMAVDALLRQKLQAAAPAYGWLSEESADTNKSSRRRWIVDPIDGTRSFMKKLPDWSIATALVEDGRAIAAALYAPVTGELFAAFAGGGATRNGAPLRTSGAAGFAGARIAGPRATLAQFTEAGLPFEPVPRIHSLALRFARVAAGEIDAALASAKSRDWDLAAADLLLHEAGGTLTTLAGTRLIYDNRDAEHPPLAAAGAALHPLLLAELGRLSADRTAPAAQR